LSKKITKGPQINRRYLKQTHLLQDLHNSSQRRDREKVTDHMRYKYVKRDIKLKHNYMNIIAYKVRQNELVTPPEPAPREGQ
jgi:hypothetical protein